MWRHHYYYQKGKVGKPVINISTSLGLDTKSDFRSVYDAMGYMKFREDWYKTTTLGFDEKVIILTMPLEIRG